ncbi:MAG: phosphoenolpyruvate--protein phosphotransferase [Elusimicrobiota bacterium]|jgi:phosphotransferase system enzyme I (PtsI)|nr:phosphoenolpyruvate--protein phosphotransferase [Elusimicrobiota bacterium]
METLQGKSGSPGAAIGTIYFYEEKKLGAEISFTDNPEAEIERLKKSLETAKTQIDEVYQKALKEAGEKDAAIFEIHKMMLEDDDYIDAILEKIRDKKNSADFAAYSTGEEFAENFSASDDEYMRARAADVRDITSRLINCILGKESAGINRENPFILAAKDLNPSQTMQFDKSKLLALITAEGSTTSHTSILARNLGIPAVLQLGVKIDKSLDGKTAAVDGNAGAVYISPDEITLKNIREKKEKEDKEKKFFLEFIGKENITRNGRKIRVCANIGAPEELPLVLENDAGGIGLFRSEFLYISAKSYPSEEEQFNAYKKVAEGLDGKEVVIRTMDIGADKQVDYFNLDKEENPALGLRGIRLSFDRPEVFKTQLRALYRASAFGNIAVMFPMIASLWEAREAKKFIDDVKKELRTEGAAFNDKTQVGIMIETPAAALICETLAPEVDFFSIGTNDLTQYTLAVDRQNQKIERYADIYHPAIMTLIKEVVEKGHKNNAWVGICGELAGNLKLTEEFLKMGIDELSVSPAKVLPLRKHIRELTI